MRPRGTFGGIAAALCAHAQVPMQVSALAARAKVGAASARYTASRLIDSGALVIVGSGRPMQVVIRPVVGPPANEEAGNVTLEQAMRQFRGSG